jgi:hypothetical protein
MSIADTWLETLKRQTSILLRGVTGTLEAIPEDLWMQTVTGFPVGQNAYHLVFSLDEFWFDPPRFVPRAGHVHGTNKLGSEPSALPTKTTVLTYWNDVRSRIEADLSQLTPETAVAPVAGSQWNRLELMIGQHRHAYFHVGWLQAALKDRGIPLPPWIGIDRDWETK